MRLIDADKIPLRDLSDGKRLCLVAFADDIKRMPIIEPERKKGKWVGYHGEDSNWQRTDGSPVFLVCSECGATVINNFAAKWNYCCACGADMRGDE